MLIDFHLDYEAFKNDFAEKSPLFIQQAFLPPVRPLDLIDNALVQIPLTAGR